MLVQAGSLSLARDPQNGRLVGTTLGQVSDSWTYDGFGEAKTYTATAGGSTAYAISFERDNVGRITTKTETIGGVTTTYAYTYDAARGWLGEKINGVIVRAWLYQDSLKPVAELDGQPYLRTRPVLLRFLQASRAY